MRKYLNSQEAAELVGLSTSKLYKLTMTRQIPHRKIFGRLRFETDKLMQWLDDQTVVIATQDDLQRKTEIYSERSNANG